MEEKGRWRKGARFRLKYRRIGHHILNDFIKIDAHVRNCLALAFYEEARGPPAFKHICIINSHQSEDDMCWSGAFVNLPQMNSNFIFISNGL